MPKLKAMTDIQGKYQTNAGNAQPYYTKAMGAVNPAEWEAKTAAAQGTWEQGVAAAVQAKSFSSGVIGKGAKLVANATNYGARRYAEGVGNAGPAWAKGFQPYYDTIASTLPTLDGRGPRGDPRNQMRANKMAQALHDRRRTRAA